MTHHDAATPTTGLPRRSFLRMGAAAGVTLPLVGSLASCADDQAGDGSTASGGQAAITYGLWAEEFRPAFQAAIDAFQAENSDVSVEIQLTPFGDYFTKLNAQISSETAPDVFWLQNIQIDLYARNDALADLTDLHDGSQVDLSGVPEDISKPYIIDGKLYAMPWQAQPFGMYYNKALFAAKGVAEPTNDWTWDDVLTAARALTDAPAGVYGIAAPVWNYGTYYHTMYQQGADIISADKRSTDFDSPDAVAGLDIWVQFVQEGLSPTPAQFSDTSADAYFSYGKIAMVTGGPWVAANYKEALGDSLQVVEMPSGPQDVTGYATTTSAVAASSPNIEAAYRLAEFLQSEPGQTILGASGIAGPGVNTAAQQAWLDAVPGIGAENLLNELPRARLLPSSLNTAAWEEDQSTTLTPAWTGEISTIEAAAEMATLIRTALAAE